MSEDAPTTLVTGALGCIGAWVLYHLTRAGCPVVSFDVGESRHRLGLLLEREEQQSIRFIRGDLADASQVLAAIRGNNIGRIIHLAALQVPFCRANPLLGAQVNVNGTVNILEAARQAGVKHIVYASSIAVYGPPAPGYADGSTAPALTPATLYGVYKVANEGTARVYWQDHGISSIGLRPYTVYGMGRDQGLTSDPTQAMLAAAVGRPFHIKFNGPCQYHYASDVARLFIAASGAVGEGARVYDLGGPIVTSAEIAGLICRVIPGAKITWSDAPLPFPAGVDGSALVRDFPSYQLLALEDGVRETIEQFARLYETGRITINS